MQVTHETDITPQLATVMATAAFATQMTNTNTTDYVGNKIYENNQLKRILVDGGYIEDNQYHFYLTDHLGNNRVVAKADGSIVQKTHYYPFGMAYAESTGQDKQPYKYNGKELDNVHGLNLYDYSARYYEPGIGRFSTVDPLAEKYYWVSPYAYALNNPIKFIDPDGKAIVLSGALSQKALKEMQGAVGSSITLTMTDDGTVCYTKNIEGDLSFNAKTIASIIDDSSVIIDLKTVNGDRTSTGNLMVGGTFMGNKVYSDKEGNKTVVADQEINPDVLGAADKHSGTPGSMTMHEITEAYKGVQDSQKSGESASPATAIDANNPNSAYRKAHDKASFQNPVYQTMYDANGKITTDASKAVRVEWSVKNIQGKDKVIQTLE